MKIKALLAHHSLEEAYASNNLQDLIRRERDLFQTAIENDSIDIRSPKEELMPFRIIALNNDKMFMFLADATNPDTVALLYREGNPLLVDTAIEKFDEIFDSATPLNDVVLQESKK